MKISLLGRRLLVFNVLLALQPISFAAACQNYTGWFGDEKYPRVIKQSDCSSFYRREWNNGGFFEFKKIMPEVSIERYMALGQPVVIEASWHWLGENLKEIQTARGVFGVCWRDTLVYRINASSDFEITRDREAPEKWCGDPLERKSRQVFVEKRIRNPIVAEKIHSKE
jgi:hypothetical protein